MQKKIENKMVEEETTIETKEEKKDKKQLNSYSFPKEELVIQATSLEEATKLLPSNQND